MVYTSGSTVANRVVQSIGWYYNGLHCHALSGTSELTFAFGLVTEIESLLEKSVSSSVRSAFHVKHGEMLKAVQVIENELNNITSESDNWLDMDDEINFIIRETLKMLHDLVKLADQE